MLVTHIPEILELIASFAGKETLLNLRLVSRLHHGTSLRAFATAWFTILDTEMSPSGIARLHSIASNKIFARAVRTVRVRIGRLKCQRQADQNWTHTKQGALDLSSPSAQMVLRSLCSFIRCNELELIDVSHVIDNFTVLPTLTATEVMYLVLSLFTLEDGPPINSVHLVEKAWFACSHASMRALRDMAASPAFQKAWASRVLDLEYRTSLGSPSRKQLLRMISGAPLLKSLSLVLDDHWGGRLLSSFSESSVVQPITDLSLTFLTTSPEVLAGFIMRYRETLTSFTLSSVCMSSHTAAWFTFFNLMTEAEFPHLEEIRFIRLLAGHYPPENIYFYPVLSTPEVFKECGGRFEIQFESYTARYPNLRYSGPPDSMRLALGALRGWASVHFNAQRTWALNRADFNGPLRGVVTLADDLVKDVRALRAIFYPLVQAR